MKYLLALYLLISSTHALGKTLNVMDTPKNLILNLSGIISGSTVNPLINSLDHLSSNNIPKRIILLIDTEGGEVVEGHHLIAAMNLATARNTAIDCVIGRKAYSMGVALLPHCSKIYALKHSVIMFHSIRERTLTPVSVSFLIQTLFSFKILGDELERKLQISMGISKDKYERLRDMELFYPAVEFDRQFPNFITIVDNVLLPQGIYLLGSP